MLQQRKNAFAQDPAKWDDAYNTLANWYKVHFEVGDTEATTYALKGLLGNSINLYIRRHQDPKFLRTYIGENGRMVKVDCPN